jgi:hypothetical protein
MPIEIKIDSAQFTKVESQLREAATDILSGSALKKEVGDFAVERLKFQARTGKPFNDRKEFPLLHDSTIDKRIYLAKYNKTHPTYEDGFSNVTLTGEFLDSLGWRDEGGSGAFLSLAFTGMHKFYVGAKGQRISKPLGNDTLAKYLAAKGFKVFDDSLQTNKQFIGRIKTICMRYIRRGLRIRNAVEDYEA